MKIKYALPLALLVSSSAFAAHTDNDWYTGLRVGATDYTDFTGPSNDSTSAIDANVGAGIFVGYNFTNWFALEGGYTYLGEMKNNDDLGITTNTIELVTKFTWQTTDNLDLFVKGGAFGYKTDGNDSYTGTQDNNDGISATAGIGAEYFFNDNISTRLEYQYYNHLTIDNAKWDTHLLAVSLVYNWSAPVVVAAVAAPIVVTQAVVEEKVEKVKEKMMKIANEKVQVSFPFDSTTLSDESMQQLTPIIEHLKEYPNSKLFLVGHTDASGPAAYNQTFSVERADALATYLSDEFSIDKSRMTISGEGENMPIATNDTKEGRAMNRRVSVFSPSFENNK
ncbi:hypothetical protein JI57_01940 [Psychromonas sp. PRT-SC03]|nr:hypothetical protein JI57_01940 [Psychromonas sp. PRT-SC03]